MKLEKKIKNSRNKTVLCIFNFKHNTKLFDYEICCDTYFFTLFPQLKIVLFPDQHHNFKWLHEYCKRLKSE